MKIQLNDGTYYVTKPGSNIRVCTDQLAFMAEKHVDPVPRIPDIHYFVGAREQVKLVPIRGIKQIEP